MSSTKSKEAKTAKGFSPSAFDMEDSAWMEVEDPITGQPTGAEILLASADSDVYSKADKKIRQNRINRVAKARGRKAPDLKVDVLDAEGLNIVVACTLDWKLFMDEKGEPLPCTASNVRDLYSTPKFKFILEQVNEFIADRANFIKS